MARLITLCRRQKREVIGSARKKRSVDRMSEENRGLREAEVPKRKVEFLLLD